MFLIRGCIYGEKMDRRHCMDKVPMFLKVPMCLPNETERVASRVAVRRGRDGGDLANSISGGPWGEWGRLRSNLS